LYLALAATVGGMKKATAAQRAARILAGTGWLPEPLRSPASDDDAAPGEPEALDEAA
jgi:ParB family transcriptional regulator, chromosome partitioning protein